jgi:hypothetical protein
MGQVCPLPDKVPMPCPDDLPIVNSWGIQFGEAEGRYASMKLPAGWSFVDDSPEHRPDLPCWRIVDADGRICASVSGAWKGMYDNDLRFRIDGDFSKWTPRKTG